MRFRGCLELPTCAIAMLNYGTWAVATLAAARIPTEWIWTLAPIGGFLLAWHGSLQHETIHGHPTRWPIVNRIVGGVPLSLWLPYGIYREQHIAHHKSEELTDPLDDPESFYVTPEAWGSACGLRRAHWRAQSTLVGRLLLGPFSVVARFLFVELLRLFRGDRRHLRAWASHAVGLALVIAWLVGVCHLSLLRYALVFVYPGLALTLLRSFLEHRPADRPAHRIASVEAGPITSLLFLNNNLHVAHHASPATPWYELPALYAARREVFLSDNGGYVFSSYARVAASYAFRAKDSPVHPRRSRASS